jgi:adenosylcobyric acid synthase
MAMRIMIQGTMSNAGKSLIAAGLCRIFRQDGYRVAPFKSQNMALNSFITKEGLEMGRAQVMQAEAAGMEPTVAMNPILLKPTNDIGSQVIVNGEVIGNMSARDYFAYKKKLVPDILAAYHRLEEQADIIVIEGAGSPAEINLKENDIVNMGLAELLNAPVLIAGDIDRGGVFAQLLGTQLLLEESERRRVKGFIINKFRGDVSILAPGIRMLEERGGVPVVGVVPYMQISLEDEDSLTTRFDARREAAVDIAVIRFPRISNFTDFSVFEQFEDVSLRYVDLVEKLHHPDMILLPGSKNTMEDLKWMRQNGLEAAILHRSAETFIFGICGGYQMLGKQIADPHGVETGGVIRGMGLLPVTTELGEQKVRTRVGGEILGGMLDGCELSGYEIHMGISRPEGDCEPFCRIRDEITGKERTDGVFAGNVCGTYVHGIFDHGSIAGKIVRHLAERKGLVLGEDGVDYGLFKEQQYDKLAATLRKYLDLDAIYKMMREYE